MKRKSPKQYFTFIAQVVRKYISCFIPKSDSVYVYGAWFGEKYADNPRYFFEYMNRTHPEITNIWISKSQDVVDKVNRIGYKACLESSAEGKKYMQKAKYVFVCTGWRDIDENYIGGATVVNFWHGVPLKKVMYDDTIFRPLNYRGKIMNILNLYPQRNEYIISTSDTFSDIYLHAFKKDKKHIVLIGQPRNDIFYSGTAGTLRERFPNKKIITYMPTHRKEGKVVFDCYKIFDLDKINDLCKKHNCVFLIKKHFYHSKEEIISGYSNIAELTQENIDAQDLMISSDVLITDYSSAYIDYLLLDRPVIFYSFDLDDYLKTDRGMYFEYDQVTPGPVVTNFDDFYKEIYSIVADNRDDYSALRNKVTDLFYDKAARQMVSPIVFDMIKNGRFE